MTFTLLNKLARSFLPKSLKLPCSASLQTLAPLHTGKGITHETLLNGNKLFWERVGEGPHSVFFLPGALGSTRTDFGPQLDGLDPSVFTLYAWDPPGYGKSRPPERSWPDRFFSRDAADAVALIRELGLEKVSLVGWSDGGITALVIAVFYPQVVSKLVLFGCNAYITKLDLDLLENVKDVSRWNEKMRKPYENMYGKKYFELLWSQWVDAYSSYLLRDSGNIVRDRVHEIKKPTLIIHGQKDPLVPQEHPSFLHSQIKNSVLVNWPDAKHNLHLRYPEKFNELVSGFLLQ